MTGFSAPWRRKNSICRAARICKRFPRQGANADPDATMSRLLILVGLLFLAAGLLWPWLSKLPFGRLPGDISIERENFGFYFPLTTSILLSLLLTLLFWLWRK